MSAKLSGALDKPMVQRLSAWVGFIGFLVGMVSFILYYCMFVEQEIGITSFLIIRMWFGKAVQDFNASIAAQGKNGPQLFADLGNAFTSEFSQTLSHRDFSEYLRIVAWVAYAFYAVPVIASLAKLNVTATKNV
jgi:hypothetical protein